MNGRMSARRRYAPRGDPPTARLAWACWTLTLGFMVALILFEHLNDPSDFLGDPFGKLVQFAFATVGLLIASRRHKNLIGWVIAIGTLLTTSSEFGIEYAVYGLATAPGSVPIPVWAALLGGWFRTIAFILTLFV